MTRFEQVFGSEWAETVKKALGHKKFLRFDKLLTQQDEMVDKYHKHDTIQQWMDYGCRGYYSLQDFFDSQYNLEEYLMRCSPTKKLLECVRKVNKLILEAAAKE